MKIACCSSSLFQRLNRWTVNTFLPASLSDCALFQCQCQFNWSDSRQKVYLQVDYSNSKIKQFLPLYICCSVYCSFLNHIFTGSSKLLYYQYRTTATADDVQWCSLYCFNVNGNVAVLGEQCLALSWLSNVNAFALTLGTDHLCRHTLGWNRWIDKRKSKTCLLLSTQSWQRKH